MAVVISCRAVVHYAAAGLPSTCLIESFCGVSTHLSYQQSLVFISTSNLSVTVLSKVGRLLAKYGCMYLQATSVETVKQIINVRIVTLGKNNNSVRGLF